MLDRSVVENTAKEVSNEFVLAGKNPGVLLVDVVAEVVRRLVGLGEDDTGVGDPDAVAAAGTARLQEFLRRATQEKAPINVLPFLRGGKVVPVSVLATRRYHVKVPQTGQVEERVDYEHFFEIIDPRVSEFVKLYAPVPQR